MHPTFFTGGWEDRMDGGGGWVGGWLGGLIYLPETSAPW
jgi:hypothetical protein